LTPEAEHPEIRDDTLNLILPCNNENERFRILNKMNILFKDEITPFTILKIKHHLNGYFLVFQTSLKI